MKYIVFCQATAFCQGGMQRLLNLTQSDEQGWFQRACAFSGLVARPALMWRRVLRLISVTRPSLPRVPRECLTARSRIWARPSKPSMTSLLHLLLATTSAAQFVLNMMPFDSIMCYILFLILHNYYCIWDSTPNSTHCTPLIVSFFLHTTFYPVRSRSTLHHIQTLPSRTAYAYSQSRTRQQSLILSYCRLLIKCCCLLILLYVFLSSYWFLLLVSPKIRLFRCHPSRPICPRALITGNDVPIFF